MASDGQAALDPLQLSATSHAPAAERHVVDDGLNLLLGHAALEPVHFSAASHVSAAARHSNVEDWNVLLGQVVCEGEQVSARSQPPEAAARQTVAEARALVSAPHVPLVVPPCAVLHAWQSVAPPPHLLLQQTPSTQKPLAH